MDTGAPAQSLLALCCLQQQRHVTNSSEDVHILLAGHMSQRAGQQHPRKMVQLPKQPLGGAPATA